MVVGVVDWRAVEMALFRSFRVKDLSLMTSFLEVVMELEPVDRPSM